MKEIFLLFLTISTLTTSYAESNTGDGGVSNSNYDRELDRSLEQCKSFELPKNCVFYRELKFAYAEDKNLSLKEIYSDLTPDEFIVNGFYTGSYAFFDNMRRAYKRLNISRHPFDSKDNDFLAIFQDALEESCRSLKETSIDSVRINSKEVLKVNFRCIKEAIINLNN